MNYLISTFDCLIFDETITNLKANAKYKINDMNIKSGLIVDKQNHTSYVLDFHQANRNIIKVNMGVNNYYFLFKVCHNEFFTTNIDYQSKKISISLFSKLFITINGVLKCEQNVENLIYSHFEIENDFCFVYFKGERNFVVVIKDDEVCFSNYYDECNITENEKLFMCKLNDALNHGLVFNVKGKESETYLVYLDNEELNLKNEFLPFVFLDCVKAGNFKYCNNLLCDEMKIENENEIKNFFSEFDFYYPIEKNKFVLTNKNTLAGIYAFDIENNKISNISCH